MLRDLPVDEGAVEHFAKVLRVDEAVVKGCILHFTMVTLSTGVYDARTRCVLLALSQALHMDVNVVLMLEYQVAVEFQSMVLTGMGETETQSVLSRHDIRHRRKQWAAIGLAGVAGGVLVGVTGGLAAPLIGAGLAGLFSSIGIGGTAAFLSGVGGTALVTSVFGATGVGLTSGKMARRVKGVGEFRLIDHDEVEVSEDGDVVCVGGKQLILKPPQSNFDTVKGWVNRKRLSESVQGQQLSETESPPTKISAPFVTISIAGWVGKIEDTVNVFGDIDHGDHFSLLYETSELIKIHDAIQTVLTSEALGYAATEVLARTMFASLMMAMVWPAALLKVGGLLDNPWSVGLERSRKAGLVLGDILFNRHQGHRPVVLVGTSLGARVIYYALQELAKRAKQGQSIADSPFGIVQDVYLIGGAIAASEVQWRRVRSVVAGRFVNGYCRQDWVLGFLFRAVGAGVGVAGIMPVLGGGEGVMTMETPDLVQKHSLGIQNVDLSDVVKGHSSYTERKTVLSVLKLMQLS
jgi:hypothetical protein